MRTSLNVLRAAAVAALALGALSPALRAADPPNFKPDGSFTGSALTGWQVIGNVDWKAQNGEIVGTGKNGGGGWLVMNKSFQDVDVFTNYKCVGTCAAGILLRAQKTPDGGMRGVFLSLSDGDFAPYSVTIDAQGKETSRERIAPAGRGGGGGGAQTGGAARAGGAAAAPAAGAAQAPAARAGGGGGGGGGGRGGQPTLKAGEWNPIELVLSAKTLRAIPGGGGPVSDADAMGFGPIALYAGGSGEVHFKDLAWKDLLTIPDPRPVTSSRYTAHQVNSFYYGWSAAASDINRDGSLDLVVGPLWFPGPNFTERRIFRDDRIYNPSNEYAPDMVNLTADFTGDGWPDILSSTMTGGRPMDLYVNPKGDSRRWDKFKVLPTINTEIVLMKDLDKDGKPEILFGGGGVYNWAHPDPANPTAVWTSHPISAPGQTVTVHGLGVGDVNSDGRLDVVMPLGWYEQPAGGIQSTPWTFHKAFWPANEFSNGGGEMGVFDVNGDGLTDVIGGSAHSWGLVWFEQQKDGSFVQRRIAGTFADQNAGGVTFSESHAARFADMNGDKVPDFIVGKRYWSHLENYNGDDPYGPAVLYIYRTVRNPKAPGGAEFVPELVHNRSGVGSAFEVMDLNKDGVPDIATSGAYGVWVFLSKGK